MKPKTRLSCHPPFPSCSLPLLPLPSLVGIHEQWKRRSKSRSPATQHANFLHHLSPPSFPLPSLFLALRIFRICLRNKFAYFSVCVSCLAACGTSLSKWTGWAQDARVALIMWHPQRTLCPSTPQLLCCDCRRGWEKVVSSTAAQIGQRRKYLLGIGPAGQCWPPLSACTCLQQKKLRQFWLGALYQVMLRPSLLIAYSFCRLTIWRHKWLKILTGFH